MLKVRDVMRTHVHLVSPATSVRAAALKLLLFNIESLVVAEDGSPVGIVTERDILAAAMPKMDEIVAADGWREVLDMEGIATSHSRQPVRDVMTRSLVTTTPDTLVSKALGSMLAHRLRRLPVLDPGTRELLGVVTQRDLLGVVYLDVREVVGVA
jgi:CBS domain-containing protein